MASGARELAVTRTARRWTAAAGSMPWIPIWSVPAAVRAARAAIVMPALFAITDQLIGNSQMALFASFGSFATLVLASFAGTRRDKLVAHLGLAVAGSVLLIIGTAVNSSTALAAIVTIPVTFAVFFAGVAGPNAASGVTAALLVYVLPAASPGTISMVPDRLAGWWIASVVGTAAVLAFPTPAAGDRLRSAASRLASALADEIDAVLLGKATDEQLHACIDAKHDLLAQFSATPFRPTGLTAPDQALANAVELLEWCTSLTIDSVHERQDLSGAAPADRELLGAAATVLRECGAMLAGGNAAPDLEQLEECRGRSTEWLHHLTPDSEDFRAHAQISFHAHAIAVTVLAIGANCVVTARLVDADRIADEGARWFGASARDPGDHRLYGLSKYTGIAFDHASLRSVWFINSARGALALAIAVAVADLSSVQHGFWVVLGTLSVLRTTAASTGSTALRALVGTSVGFALGAALLLTIGTSSMALWVALPIAVFVAAYAPGTAPFAVGQAAFTLTIAILFNLLVPVGWRVGEVRLEDVAIGCAVSVAVGVLFWPRGASSVVGDDLADSYRSGAAYLSHAVRWVCGIRADEPDGVAAAAVSAGFRLDDALRAFLAEQGSKRIKKQQLWRLVGGAMRLRLTAHAVASLPPDAAETSGSAAAALDRRTAILSEFFEDLATQVGRPRGQPVAALTVPTFDGADAEGSAPSPGGIWLSEDLDHLSEHLCELIQPAAAIAELRRRPWWR